MRALAAAALTAALLVAGCGGESAEDVPDSDGSEYRGAESPPTFGPDFTAIALGPRLEGSEFETRLRGPQNEDTGTLTGYVACDDGLTSCTEAGENAVYTYVLEVTPRAPSSAFRTAERAYGFTGTAGYDKAQARAAMPGDSRLAMLCSDGVLVWAIEGGEGWSGKPVTLYWQSTSPPDGTVPGYVLITDGKRASASAPLPSEGSTDKCG